MIGKEAKILIVDDEKISSRILRDFLSKNYNVILAENGEETLEILKKEKIDLILLDIIMKGMDGYEVCKKIKENSATKDIPVIFVTARNEHADESKGLDMGAVDYIKKPYYLPIVKARIKTHLKLKEKNDILESLVSLDGLTNVFNRRKYDEYISEKFNDEKIKTVGLLMIDVDDFKLYNDNYGHSAGDECLIELSKNINLLSSKENFFFARYGGEEFVAFFENIEKSKLEKYACEILKILEEIRIPYAFSEIEDYVTVSIGGVFQDLLQGERILNVFAKTADDMLYISKKQGKNRYTIMEL